MSAACRLNDTSYGHCHSPLKAIEGSGDVFINSLPAHRQGDVWTSHSCGGTTIVTRLMQGSPTVFVNGKQLGRVDDPLTCGDRVGVGSSNVFIGP